MQPSEMDALPFYRIEYLIEKIKEDNENEENKRNTEKKTQLSQQTSFDKQQSQMKGQMKNLNKGMPSLKMPDFGGFKF